MEWGTLIPAFFGSLPGVAALIAVLVKGKAESNKFKADAASSLVSSAVDLAGAKDTIIEDLRRRVAVLEEEEGIGKKDRAKLHEDIMELAKLIERGRVYVLELYEKIKELGGVTPETPEILKKENWPDAIK